MRLTRLEGQAQGHTLAQQVLLAYDFAQAFRAQTFGQGLVVARGLGHAVRLAAIVGSGLRQQVA